MTDSDARFGMKAAVAAIAAAAIVGGVLYALYPSNYGTSNAQNYNQGQTTTAGQSYTNSTGTASQNASNTTSQSSSKPPASDGSGY